VSSDVVRELYRRRHRGSSLRIMAYRGVWRDGADRPSGQNTPYDANRESQDRGDPSTHRVLSHDLLGRVVWREGVGRTFGQNNLSDFDWSWTSQPLDGLFCRWCWSPMPPYDPDHTFCVGVGMTTRITTGAGTLPGAGIPGGPTFIWPCVGGARGGI